MQLQQAVLLGEFFEFIFGDTEGYFCLSIAERQNPKGTFRDVFFEWPKQRNELLKEIDRRRSGHHVWFCVHLLEKPERKKEYATECSAIWADLDECSPEEVEPSPPVVVESSPDRYQAIWPLANPIPPRIAEDYARRFAYFYRDKGVDVSGWDLTQLLRVPLTKNYKYPGAPPVKIVRGNPAKVPVELFDQFPAVDGIAVDLQTGIPDNVPDPDDVITNLRSRIPQEFYLLRGQEPPSGADWSKRLWRLLILGFESGMEPAEVFSVALDAACNKYERDDRPPLHLWHDVLRAQETHRTTKAIIDATADDLQVPQLVTQEEYDKLDDTFIERYIEWASKLGDAASQYHEAGAFVILSSLLAGNLRLESNIGTIVPNLWFMILADTTLTRKSTAMDRAMDLLTEIDMDALLATDGSVEGLLQALSARPRRPSVFLRDEVTGLVDSMVRKDYMAGMLETLTKLYDSRTLKRVLKKEEILIRDPVLVFFAGGIRNKMEAILSDEHITSGFLPRFIIITAVSSMHSITPLGPGNTELIAGRETLRAELATIHERYAIPAPEVTVAGHTIMGSPDIRAKLDEEAWKRYNEIYMALMETAVGTIRRDIYTPIFDRFSTSLLKMAVLIAATRQEPNEKREIEVTVDDIVRAGYFGNKWLTYTLEIIPNIGVTANERMVERIYRQIKGNPGVQRSRIMRNNKLSAWEMDNILKTLEGRGLISATKMNRSTVLHPED